MVVRGLISSLLLSFLLIFTLSVEAKGPSKEVKASLAPYMLPDDHPIKPILDAIFAADRVTFNLDSMRKAGFDKCAPREFTKIIVTRHPALPGYIFKLYLDAQRFHKDLPEYALWTMRIKGAEKIRQEIFAHNLEDTFKVPQKWIYALPTDNLPPEGYYTKYYILVEEDMEILSDKENKAYWASDSVTEELLLEVYKIIKKLGLSDCAKPDNIPFSRDGRIAFIDTQTYGEKSIKFKKLTPFLSKRNQAYWKEIISQ